MNNRKDLEQLMRLLLFCFLIPTPLNAQSVNSEPQGQLAFSTNANIRNTVAAIREKVATPASTTRIIIGLNTSAVNATPSIPISQLDAIEHDAIVKSQEVILKKIPSLNVQLKNKSQKNRKYDHFPFMAVEVNSKELESLLNLPEVASIEAEQILSLNLVESTEFIGASTPTSRWGNWSQRNNGVGAWSKGVTGVGQTVAILDTGVDKNHSFVAGKVVSEACYSGGGNTIQSLCPNAALSSTLNNSGQPCLINGCYHGTHVAGIAAGKGTTFSGVAPDAQIIAIQVFSNNGSLVTFTGDFLAGLDRIYSLRDTFKIASVNMSFGGGVYQSICDSDFPATKSVLDKLLAVGIAPIIASGNSYAKNGVSYPACLSSAVSVGATLDYPTQPTLENSLFNSSVASFSNSASFLSLLAPGSNINSSIPGGGFAALDGTSMAAPHVAGAWALLKQKAPFYLPVSSALSTLQQTGEQSQDSNGVVKPRINISRAIDSFNLGQPQPLNLINSILLDDQPKALPSTTTH